MFERLLKVFMYKEDLGKTSFYTPFSMLHLFCRANHVTSNLQEHAENTKLNLICIIIFTLLSFIFENF